MSYPQSGTATISSHAAVEAREWNIGFVTEVGEGPAKQETSRLSIPIVRKGIFYGHDPDGSHRSGYWDPDEVIDLEFCIVISSNIQCR
jgi:hypothetical protein